MQWIISNLGTIIVSIILVAIVSLILYSMLDNKRKGKSSCGCNCSCCPSGGMCHRNEQQAVDGK